MMAVNIQTKQDRATVLRALMAVEKGLAAFASSSFHTPDFCVLPIRLLVLRKLSTAYAVWHFGQCGSGTCTDSPGSFRGRLQSFGCSQPSGDSLHLESSSVSGDAKLANKEKRLSVVFSYVCLATS
uniref:Uncharacterized protein n=1 Tax=Nothobranchius kadleci TaxID=1051664 RepID=A0A1A8E2R2_NOTKA